MNQVHQQKSPAQCGLITLAQVCKEVNRERTTVYRWVKQGFFPKPLYLNKRPVGWRIEDYLNWRAAN